MFGSCFCKLFLRTVFENIENTILVFSENCHCSLNLLFSVFSVSFRKKKLGTKHVLLVLFVFENKK